VDLEGWPRREGGDEAGVEESFHAFAKFGTLEAFGARATSDSRAARRASKVERLSASSEEREETAPLLCFG